MSSKWPAWEQEEYVETTWGDLVELKYGKGLQGYKGAFGEFPVFGTNGPVGYCDKSLCEFPSVIIGRKGAYRGVHFSDMPFYVIDTAYFVVPKFNINLKWAYYSLLTHDINGLDSGSAIPSTRREDFYAMPAIVPPRIEQDRIVNILESIDEKIQLNRQINQTLEAIAQAIFKSWFVDFDPTRAKIAANECAQARAEGASTEELIEQLLADGRWTNNQAQTIAQGDPELAAMSAISGQFISAETNKEHETHEQNPQLTPEKLNELRQTAALFPSALLGSELGEIPEGWEVKPLDEVAHYQNGLALQKFRPESENDFLPVLKIAQLKKGYCDSSEKASPNIKSSCIVNNGDVIFSWSGSLVVDFWCGGVAALNQHLFKVTSEEYPKWFYYYWTKIHLESFQQTAADKAVTMGHIKREHLSEAKCLVPPMEMVEHKVIGEFLDAQIELRLEDFKLQEIRDSILPKLLSGELAIKSTQSESAETP